MGRARPLAAAAACQKTVLHTLTAYYSYLRDGGYSPYTPDNFTGDVKKFGVFLKDTPIKDIATRDIQSWIALLKTPPPKGEGLTAKTISRKLTALSNYYTWLEQHGVVATIRPKMRAPMALPCTTTG